MRRHVFALFLLAAFGAGSAAESREARIETRMDDAARTRTGIAKLTPAELAELNTWLAAEAAAESGATPARSTATAGATPGAAADIDRIGLRERATRAEEPKLESRIVGTFRGLAPRATFRLENGQVWRSVDSMTVFRGVIAESPEAVISKSRFGGWRLRLPAHRGLAKVERVR